jgi:pimeloyl-ACP methyl ester carboxylesterase
MPTIAIDNAVPYAYDEAGQGDPLLLIHAGIADRRMWDDVMPALSNRHRVVRVDLRGYGDTPLPDGPFVHAADLAVVLEALAISRAHICGVSMGAGVALDLTLSRPDLVDRIVLVAPSLPTWAWDPDMDDFDASEAEALDRGDLEEASWLNVRFWVDGPSRRPDEVDAALRQRVFEMQHHAFELDNPAADAVWLVMDRQQRLGEVTASTLIIVGDLDQPDFADIGRHIVTQLPDGRLVEMPGVAHLPPVEAPESFSRLVLDHLAR